MMRVLVVDDEYVLRKTFQHALEEEGLDVYVGENGKQGIDLCARFKPQLVITDIAMPGLDGFTMIDAIARRHPDTVIVAMSGLADVAGRDHALRCGAQCFIPKPIDIATMRDLVMGFMSFGDDARQRVKAARGVY